MSGAGAAGVPRSSGLLIEAGAKDVCVADVNGDSSRPSAPTMNHSLGVDR
jgi:hypothetical protein